MFRSVLIANRGEIAMRVARTCRRLGIHTVAVYSAADRDAPHVAAADEALPIGPADATASYLSIERLLAAARQSGAEALHPGYGFLSERPELSEACAAAGIAFVGPSAAAMRALGDKIGARRLAQQHGVPVAPGYDGDEQDEARLAAEAARIGFPLMIKAAAGGGGRGMRRVAAPGDFPAALAAARQEAERAFGDGRLFLERIVERARHVEVQLLADGHGRALAVGDRDCSLQRRHQKVAEEGPAPDLPDALRAATHRAAERLAAGAGYSGAGTAEFLVADGAASFLELNARLQVEHSVTEMVTGLDLVEWQLRLAAGEPLGLDEARCAPRGHAIQARVYAEDPAAGHLPAAGRLRYVRWPAGPGVRVDASVTAAGQVVPPEYDPLLGKVICWGETRAAALASLDAALAETVLLGLPTNAAYLRRLLHDGDFRAGPVHTVHLDAHPELATAPPPPPALLQAAAQRVLGGPPAWRDLAGWRAGGRRRPLRLQAVDPSRPGEWLSVHPLPAPDSASQDATALRAVFLPGPEAGELEAGYQGGRWLLALDVPRAPDVDPAAPGTPDAGSRAPGAPAARQPASPDHWLVVAPLPGKLAQLSAAEDQRVEAGASLATVEAMKIQHTVTTPRAGRVTAVLARPGAFVRAGQPLLELGPC